ncbi:putative protein ASPARTIC PROTEASE IN GUARD CELL 2-like [Capsicum annuum]|nr:putative protein ASPARTIC PROTEASE IN GUARD CELL 2-like [Capsicum annuum]
MALHINTLLANRLVDMYSKCSSLEYAQRAFNEVSNKNCQSWNTKSSAYYQRGLFGEVFKVFDEMPEPNVESSNSIVSSLTRCGFPGKAMGCFKRMGKRYGDDFLIDEFTVVGVVNACACLGVLKLLRELHGLAIVVGVRFNLVVCNALIDAYGKCGKPEYSYSILCRMHETDVFSWTSMLVAYIRASRLADACTLFDSMPVRNVVAWTALITGFTQNGEGDKASCVFKEMLEEGIVPNASTYVSVLGACADIPLIEKGKQNYQAWAIRMTVHLEALDLWEAVEEDYEVTPLGDNPTVNQMRHHKERKTRKVKAKACLFSAVSASILTRIIQMKSAVEIWEYLENEYQGNERVQNMQVMNLIREFEMKRMKEFETIKDYADQLLDLSNKVRLFGKDFTDERIVQKILVTLPEKYEATISSLKNSKDLSSITLAELVNALQALEQRRIMRKEGFVEGFSS